jgi:hypothetical protein
MARFGSIASAREVCLGALLLAAAIFLFSGWFTPVRFDRERIDIWAAPGQIQVVGLYHYRNSAATPTLLTLGVPFPIDGGHPRPQTVLLEEIGPDAHQLRPIETRCVGDELRFRLFFRAHEEKRVRLMYVQAALSPHGTYILHTTRAWRRPLELGEYELHLSPLLRLEDSNYPVTASSADSYSFTRTDFYPDADWRFTWREVPARTLAGGISHEEAPSP